MDPDRREVLSAAFEEAEKPEPVVETPVAEPVPATEAVAPEPAPAKVEAETAAPPTDQPATDPIKAESEAAERAGKDGTPDASGGDDRPVKAPASWSPAEREKWASIPPDLQKTIHKRELEITQTLSRTAQERRVAQEYLDTVKPYEQLIHAQNSTPRQAITNMMETARVLTTGTPQQKASMVAQVIANFNVDVQELDSILVNRPPPQRQEPQGQIPPHILQQLQPALSLAQRAQEFEQQRAQRLQAEAAEAIQRISEREFYEDLRMDMADVMELAAKRGQKLTLEEAYDKAAELHPEISKIVRQRAKANEVSEAAAVLARARNASSSVKGAPASGGNTKPVDKNDRRAVISSLFDQ